MKVGDLVICYPNGSYDIAQPTSGIIVGFNEKGSGGKDFVHVLCNGTILIFLSHDIEASNEN